MGQCARDIHKMVENTINSRTNCRGMERHRTLTWINKRALDQPLQLHHASMGSVSAFWCWYGPNTVMSSSSRDSMHRLRVPSSSLPPWEERTPHTQKKYTMGEKRIRNTYRVVFTAARQHTFVGWMPLDRCDRLAMPRVKSRGFASTRNDRENIEVGDHQRILQGYIFLVNVNTIRNLRWTAAHAVQLFAKCWTFLDNNVQKENIEDVYWVCTTEQHHVQYTFSQARLWEHTHESHNDTRNKFHNSNLKQTTYSAKCLKSQILILESSDPEASSPGLSLRTKITLHTRSMWPESHTLTAEYAI